MFTIRTKLLALITGIFATATIASNINDRKVMKDIIAEKNYLRDNETRDPKYRTNITTQSLNAKAEK